MAQRAQCAGQDRAGPSCPSDAVHDDSLSARDVTGGELRGLPHTAPLSVRVLRCQAATEILERYVVGDERRRIVVRGVQADDVAEAQVAKRKPVEFGIRKRHARQASRNIRDDEE